MVLSSWQSQHDVSHHCFADDTQAYTHASRSQASAVANQLNTCIADVADWCGSHRLQLNTDKTNLCGSVRRRHCSPYRHLIEVLLSARIQSKRVIVRAGRAVRLRDEHASSDREDHANMFLLPATSTSGCGFWDARWQHNSCQHLS